jgi:hypothetical protein
MIERKVRILLFLVVLGCLLACDIAVPRAWRDNPLFSNDDDLPPGGGDPGGVQADPGGTGPVSGEDGDTGDTSGGMGLKPVCFLNTGTTATTVMAWSFIPIGSGDLARPSDASTVAFPGGNSSACLSLPLGTYTWCYHWELGDLDGDGYIDYSHAIDTRAVILDESDTDDLDLAERIALSVPPGFNEIPGPCNLGNDEIRWGDGTSEWSVVLEGGIVVGGGAGGGGYYTWTVTGGSFDGTTLDVRYITSDVEGCAGTMEAWWQVTATTVTSQRIVNGCGTESTEAHSFTRTE